MNVAILMPTSRFFVACLCLAAGAMAGCRAPYASISNLDSDGSSIICFGDSITRGYGATRGNDYPARLAQLIHRPVANAGVDGDTTTSALLRIERDVLSRDPLVVIVELGGNDFLKRIPLEETRRNLDRIVAACIRQGAMVVLVHGKYGLFSDPYLEDFRVVAANHGASLVENFLHEILGRPSLMSDQIHPNDDGYTLVAQRIADVLGPLLEAAGHGR